MIRKSALQSKVALNRSYRSISNYAGNNVLGIMREDFGMWERRAPLSPAQVMQLLDTNKDVKVVVQPCTRRIFSDVEYERAGATINEDLSKASFVIGVKSPKADTLIANKSYMFFSHTIKAQPYSMPLLDTILKKNIRLYDYETITKGGRDDTPRTVAFGGYAGRAGMIDGLQGLGLRLLAEGYSTPFLHLPTTYMHQNWAQAQEAIRKMGELITTTGLPEKLSPLVVAFTGRGNVTKGAREVFDLLPHEYVTVAELPTLAADVKSGKRAANKVYGVVAEMSDLAELKDEFKSAAPAAFDRDDYFHNPARYQGKFHRTVLPYITMLANGVYWEDRFPRVLTKAHLAHLRSPAGGNNRNLRVVADISCDYAGSVEFLERFTSIEDPYFTFNPEHSAANALGKESPKEEITSAIDGTGVLVLGVDNLPSELPRDASEHFGAALLPLIPPILKSKGAADMADLPAELQRACLFSGGQYQPKWSYIARLREQAAHQHAQFASSGVPMVTTSIELVGHLFDTGLINQVLDLLETHAALTSPSKQVDFTVANCDVRPNNSSGAQFSRVRLELKAREQGALQDVMDLIQAAVDKTPKAEGAVVVTKKMQSITVAAPRRVLLFGSGRVAKPLVKLLDTLGDVEVVIATEDEAQAQDLMSAMGKVSSSGNSKASFVKYRFPEDNQNLPELIGRADVVVSLLPATMHVPIAEESIRQARHMVTASYVSAEMAKLDDRAKQAGVVILNEVGLDPGIDHLLIMKSIDDITARGGVVKELVSLCGGLPDPVAADNPLRYKMSWSPKGVLSAAGNSARYLADGQVIEVPGEQLLLSTTPSNRIPTLRLEVIPNRDSISYKELYNVPKVHSICRGTLRYEGG